MIYIFRIILQVVLVLFFLFCRAGIFDGDAFIRCHVVYFGGTDVDPVFPV